MTVEEKILFSDIYNTGRYACQKQTDWGVMFYDGNNPTKHDINHAYILDNDKFSAALDEIIIFYKKINITPRVYLLTSQEARYKEILSQKSFEIYTVDKYRHFLLSEENKLVKTSNLKIRHLKTADEITPKLLHNLYDSYMREDNDTINRMKKQLISSVKSPFCTVFAGYYDDEPVCIAEIIETNYDMFCFDLVEVGKDFQNRGFGKELVNFLVSQRCKPTYLYSENPVAIHIYEQAGFREIKIEENPVYFRAVYKQKAR